MAVRIIPDWVRDLCCVQCYFKSWSVFNPSCITCYIFPGNQVAIPGKNHSSNTITHISRKNGSATLEM